MWLALHAYEWWQTSNSGKLVMHPETDVDSELHAFVVTHPGLAAGSIDTF